MIVEALGKKWDINDITLEEKRALHKKNVIIWHNATGEETKLRDPGAWIDLLDEVREIAGLVEKDLIDKRGNALSMADIDTVCLAIFTEYVGGPSPKESGD
jgi:hypothetical protein|tara:strand:+ start:1243 stop:1545 length:303 start_codon:yes stop_codon:yes gene_type:complete